MKRKIEQQLMLIDSLLRSPGFSLSIAKLQEAAYHTASGLPVLPFLQAGENTASFTQTAAEENVAINLAGFYALECGVDFLCNTSHSKPTDWLEKITTGKIDPGTVLFLNRFANATWKAGQPFRSLDRITRPVFTGASFLPEDEIRKDYDQIKTAAAKLLLSLQNVKENSTDLQMQKIRDLLHSQSYAEEMAAVMGEGYISSSREKNPLLIASKEQKIILNKSFKDQKIAINLAGFYALECGVNYIVTIKNTLPSDVLQSIVQETISKEDKNLFARFANATWKAGQPFRGLKRIERETFTPFYFLQQDDVEKDWVQIRTAAKRLLEEL